MEKIVVFGPGPVFKGGIANYTTSLAKAFDRMGSIEVYIVSWTQQYPAIFPRDFIDRSSKSDLLKGTNIKVHYITNFNNPFSWKKTVRLIQGIKPRMVIFNWVISIQGIPMSYIARKLKKLTNIELVFDLHNVKPKVNSRINNKLSRKALKNADTFVAHAYKMVFELQEMFPDDHFYVIDKGTECMECGRTVIKLYHPIYDMYQPDPNFDVEAQKKELNLNKYVFLYFGFIRKYKGLHNCLEAFAKVAAKRDDVTLLIAGESYWGFYDNKKFLKRMKNTVMGLLKIMVRKQDDERNYRPLELIDKLGIKDKVCLVNEFIPNEEVHKYFHVSDAILLYYHTAAPSGIESIAYNFKVPILATRVGHFPETVTDGYNGYLADLGDVGSMADAMINIIERPINPENVAEAAKYFSWDNYARVILNKFFIQ